MSRCVCCDALLNEWETKRKNSHGEYLFTCTKCQQFVTYYDKELPEDNVTIEAEIRHEPGFSDDY